MTHEQLRQLIYSDEDEWYNAIEWMEKLAMEEDNLTYFEDDVEWEKNATQLIQEGYMDRYIDWKLK